ncbi:MAG: YebC/PmpR family DNA-binding transcriptional regulator [Ignavibacteriae bacterium]|nr:YebC/PmpR family DNA-binding transcriptional regulator [Ignavibacteriota bacterium]MCB9242391.1 YebC/PmpR family DNA-binding transcriptional regulator [Ignavibacteriales bacterium]
MSGHSKWSTIKRKKAAIDAKRGKIFTKLLKEITVAAKEKGGDPDANPRLRLAINTAKSNNTPMDNINRAIKKGTGELEGVSYEEINYEAYGPHGVAVIIECLTDNKNRTVADLRHLISKNGGNMGESGSVAWMFERKGVISIKKSLIKEDDLMEIILEAGADDLKSDDDYYEVISSVENFEDVRKALEGKGIESEESSLQYLAKDLVEKEGKEAEDVIRFVEAIEDNDDVQNVYSNADLEVEEEAG